MLGRSKWRWDWWCQKKGWCFCSCIFCPPD